MIRVRYSLIPYYLRWYSNNCYWWYLSENAQLALRMQLVSVRTHVCVQLVHVYTLDQVV